MTLYLEYTNFILKKKPGYEKNSKKTAGKGFPCALNTTVTLYNY